MRHIRLSDDNEDREHVIAARKAEEEKKRKAEEKRVQAAEEKRLREKLVRLDEKERRSRRAMLDNVHKIWNDLDDEVKERLLENFHAETPHQFSMSASEDQKRTMLTLRASPRGLPHPDKDVLTPQQLANLDLWTPEHLAMVRYHFGGISGDGPRVKPDLCISGKVFRWDGYNYRRRR
jgi:hypothetical protein